MPKIGEVLNDRYQVQQVLGRGGTATVFRGFDLVKARPVALKIVVPEQGVYSAMLVRRFDREVQILATLRNPHTVTLFDSGVTATGVRFMVFEYVPGRDLSNLMSERRQLTAEATVDILRQVLASLEEAHGAGLLHRDIKPENIRIFESALSLTTVKLLDFGIARHTSRAPSKLTQTGELVGTPRYMSPEQLTEAELTPASDIYSLGIVAFEMLMGRDALQAGNRLLDQMDRLVDEATFTGPEIVKVHPQLAAVVAKMTARHVADRFQTADDVLNALALLDVQSAEQPPRQEQPPRHRVPTMRDRVRAVPWWAWVVTLVVFLAAIAIPVRQILEKSQVSPPVRVTPPTQSGVALTIEAPQQVEVVRDDVGVDLPSTTCAGPAPFVGAGTMSGMDGLRRIHWLAHIPANYDPEHRYPLLVLFHQDAQTPEQILTETKLGELADQKGFVIVAPFGGRTFSWNRPEQIDDAVSQIELTADQLCIDTDRVFALGHGPGGRAAVALRCKYALAALATTSYRLESNQPICDEFEPIPYISMSPLKDRNAPVEGGAGCSLVPKEPLSVHEGTFRRLNNCSKKAPREVRSKGSVCFEWPCDVAFVGCHLDGGRGWPGTGPRLLGQLGGMLRGGDDGEAAECDGDPPDFPIGERVWQFFEDVRPGP